VDPQGKLERLGRLGYRDLLEHRELPDLQDLPVELVPPVLRETLEAAVLLERLATPAHRARKALMAPLEQLAHPGLRAVQA